MPPDPPTLRAYGMQCPESALFKRLPALPRIVSSTSGRVAPVPAISAAGFNYFQHFDLTILWSWVMTFVYWEIKFWINILCVGTLENCTAEIWHSLHNLFIEFDLYSLNKSKPSFWLLVFLSGYKCRLNNTYKLRRYFLLIQKSSGIPVSIDCSIIRSVNDLESPRSGNIFWSFTSVKNLENDLI